MKLWKTIFPFLLILFVLPLTRPVSAQEPPPTSEPMVLPAPAGIINAVNALRWSYGIAPLAVHPVLMQIAQEEASGIAAGFGGHWRPAGMTLGQWMLSLGYPLSGDLSLDGYRSENWVAAATADDAVNAWLMDDPHTNTMLSTERSDIGAGVASDGGQIYVVIETALQTQSGQMQFNARPTLTALAGAPQTSDTNLAMDDSSQYMQPIALNTAMPNGEVYHEVRHGQTLWSIAINYHTTIKQIQQWNHLQDNIITEGQKLLVGKGATPPAPEAATFQAALPAMIVVPASRPSHTPLVTQTSVAVFEASGQSQSENAFVIGAIALSALLLGGVFARMTRQRAL